MCGGRDELLFAIVRRRDIHFLDLLDHRVFDDASLTKSLLRTAVTNWPPRRIPLAVTRNAGVRRWGQTASRNVP